MRLRNSTVRVRSSGRTPGPAHPQRILVVDDHVHLRLILGRYLTGLGYRTEEAQDVDSAMLHLHSGSFRWILLDLNLPGGGGMRVFRAMEQAGGDARSRVIFMTGGFLDASTAALVEAEGVPILHKPFELAELRAFLLSHSASGSLALLHEGEETGI